MSAPAQPANEAGEAVPAWRRDETFSDWTILVQVSVPKEEEDKENSHANDATMMDTGNATTTKASSSTGAQTYNVHRVMLADGTRRSLYFDKLFRSGFAEKGNSTSKLKLEPLVAKAFPEFLDYLYGHPLEKSAETATALYHLGDYFEVECLMSDVVAFATEKISMGENLEVFYQHALALNNERMLDLFVSNVAKHVHKIEPTAPIVKVFDVNLWERVLQYMIEVSQPTVGTSRHISLVLAEFCAGKVDSGSDVEVLALSEGMSMLPALDPLAALKFLGILEMIGKDVASNDRLFNFPKKCRDALVQNWRTVANWDLDNRELLGMHDKSFILGVMFDSLKEADDALESRGIKRDYVYDAAGWTGTALESFGDGKWRCNVCGVYNDSVQNVCASCETNRSNSENHGERRRPTSPRPRGAPVQGGGLVVDRRAQRRAAFEVARAENAAAELRRLHQQGFSFEFGNSM